MLTLQRQEEIMNILRRKKPLPSIELSETLFASGRRFGVIWPNWKMPG